MFIVTSSVGVDELLEGVYDVSRLLLRHHGPALLVGHHGNLVAGVLLRRLLRPHLAVHLPHLLAPLLRGFHLVLGETPEILVGCVVTVARHLAEGAAD